MGTMKGDEGSVVANDVVGNKVLPSVLNAQKARKDSVPFLESNGAIEKRHRDMLAQVNSSIKDQKYFSDQLREEIVDLNETLWMDCWLVENVQVIVDRNGLMRHHDLDHDLKSD